MGLALFRVEGPRAIPLPGAEGPWMAGALSGSAVRPLVAALSEKIAAPFPTLAARITIEFLRPVPRQPLDTHIEILREGRKQQVLRLALSANGKQVVAATIVRLRVVEPTSAAGAVTSAPTQASFDPPQGDKFLPALGEGSDFLRWLDSRMLSSDVGLGLGEAWFRFHGTIVEGQPMTPLTRAALFSDFGNGLAPIVDSRLFTYMNADLSLHLARLPCGEWLNLKCRTVSGENGLATVCTELGDAFGAIGWAHQSLLLERRQPDGGAFT